MRLLPKRESVSSLCMNIYHSRRARASDTSACLLVSYRPLAPAKQQRALESSVAERFIVIRTVTLYLFDGCAESTAFSQPHAAP